MTPEHPPKISVLQVHNRYKWSPGGEISVLESEAELLREHGHEVNQYFVDNSDDAVTGLANKLRTAKNIVWSNESLEKVREAIRQHKPDIVHVHNFFVHISPSVYKACNVEGVPVVQTLHNFRTCCAEATLLRDSKPCQDCVGKLPLPALRHKCYRGSLAATLPLVVMQQFNRLNGAFTEMCDGYICLSGFAKEIFVRSGLPAEKLHVKPNFAADHGASALPRKNQIVYVGRFEREKGPEVMVRGWLKSQPQGWTCELLGEGSMKEALMEEAKGCDTITFHGWKEKPEVEKFIQESKYVAMSSVCYEGFPLALAEALSFGTPAIVPNHGAMPEIVQAPEIGFEFEATNHDAMATTINTACAVSDEEYSARSAAARQRFEDNYTPAQNYNELVSIYHAVREQAAKDGHLK